MKGGFCLESKLLSDKEIRVIVQSTADEIKEQMRVVNESAAQDFYDADIGGGGVHPDAVSNLEYIERSVGSGINPRYSGYERTGGFKNLGKMPVEKQIGNKIELTYKYTADDLTVNEWDSPWGIHYPGEPQWAFDTGFVHGLHGGPRPHKTSGGIKWSWSGVPQSTPIWELIVQGVKSLK